VGALRTLLAIEFGIGAHGCLDYFAGLADDGVSRRFVAVVTTSNGAGG
jgi:hypothetical protein